MHDSAVPLVSGVPTRPRRGRVGAQGAALIAGRPVRREESDGLWAVLSVEVYQLLTGQSGWTPEQYEAWAADTVDRLTAGWSDPPGPSDVPAPSDLPA